MRDWVDFGIQVYSEIMAGNPVSSSACGATRARDEGIGGVA